jgi:hypothetical protein
VLFTLSVVYAVSIISHHDEFNGTIDAVCKLPFTAIVDKALTVSNNKISHSLTVYLAQITSTYALPRKQVPWWRLRRWKKRLMIRKRSKIRQGLQQTVLKCIRMPVAGNTKGGRFPPLVFPACSRMKRWHHF